MILRHRLTRRAKRDIAFAREWYKAQGEDLANQFVDELQGAFRVICQRPSSFPAVMDEIRSARCDRFPYRIYFVPHPECVDILAVYHTSRNPGQWDDPSRD